MKKCIAIGLLCVMMIIAGGCAESFSADSDLVYVQKKGRIMGANVAAFDKEYYDEAELSDFINKSVDDYVASSGDGTISVDEFAVEDGVAHVYLEYAGYEDYADFNGVEFYAGSVLDAMAEGYDIPDGLTPVTEKDTAWDAESNKIVIIGQQTGVRVDGTILFVSQNVEVTGKNTADVAFDMLDDDAEPAYIVYR